MQPQPHVPTLPCARLCAKSGVVRTTPTPACVHAPMEAATYLRCILCHCAVVPLCSVTGIGVTWTQRGRRGMCATALTPGAPGALSGIRYGDMVTHINGRNVAGQPFDEVAALLRSFRGTDIKLELQPASPLQLMNLDLIHAPYVLYGVKYIDLVPLAPFSADRVIAGYLDLILAPYVFCGLIKLKKVIWLHSDLDTGMHGMVWYGMVWYGMVWCVWSFTGRTSLPLRDCPGPLLRVSVRISAMRPPYYHFLEERATLEVIEARKWGISTAQVKVCDAAAAAGAMRF